MEGEVTGMIQGGWPYVWGAYGSTWAVLLAFTVRALLRAARPPNGRNS